MRDTDQRHRFLIESCDVRGHLVHLDQVWADATARTEYPEPVAQVLGEVFVATALLAGTIKYEGKITLQVRGNGPVHLLVVQINNEGDIRGLARWTEVPEDTSLASTFGSDARMTITIEADAYSEPYQGIVPLEGESVAEGITQYFVRSEQLDTVMHLSVSKHSAAGLLLQSLPKDEVDLRTLTTEDGSSTDDAVERAVDDGDSLAGDGWQRAVTLGATVTAEELHETDAQTLLHRLYHEETVRLFDPESLQFNCSCSRERTDGMLLGLGEKEALSIVEEQGSVGVTCEFCDAHYEYDAVDIASLFKGVASEPGSDTLH